MCRIESNTTLVATTEVLALFEPVHGAAIGALRLAGARHVQVDARVAVPQLHAGAGAGAEHLAVGVQVPGQQFDDCFFSCACDGAAISNATMAIATATTL